MPLRIIQAPMVVAPATITVVIPSGSGASCPTTEDSWLAVVDNLAALPDISPDDPPARHCAAWPGRTPCPAPVTEAPDTPGERDDAAGLVLRYRRKVVTKEHRYSDWTKCSPSPPMARRITFAAATGRAPWCPARPRDRQSPPPGWWHPSTPRRDAPCRRCRPGRCPSRSPGYAHPDP